MQTSSLRVFGAVQLLVSCRWTDKNKKTQNGTSLSFIWTAIWFLVFAHLYENNELFFTSFVASRSANYQHWPVHQMRPFEPDMLSEAWEKRKKKPLKNWTAIISIMSQRVKLKYDSFVVKWKPVCVVLCTNNFPASRRALSESWRA